MYDAEKFLDKIGAPGGGDKLKSTKWLETGRLITVVLKENNYSANKKPV